MPQCLLYNNLIKSIITPTQNSSKISKDHSQFPLLKTIPSFFHFSINFHYRYKQSLPTFSLCQLRQSSVLQHKATLMKIGRTDSQGQPFHFFRIKDLHFFRHLLWRYDLSLVKDYLHSSLDIVPLDPSTTHALDQEYVYIPNEQAHINLSGTSDSATIRGGHIFPEGIDGFTAKNSFILYKISKKTVQILQKLYFLELPLMNGMKSCEKFCFLQRCEVEQLNFNSFVYRRGEEVEAIYYLLQGQMKMFKQLGENVYEIASLEKGRMFGLFQVKSRMKQRELYAKASLNCTKILKIPMKLIEKLCIQRETTIESLLTDAKSEIYSMIPKNQNPERKSILHQKIEKQAKNGDASSRVILERRLKTFESSRMIKSSVIENLVYSKKMLYRVKELNQRMQNCKNRPSKLQSQNVHMIKHFNDKWKCHKDKNCGEDRGAISRDANSGKTRAPFKRLMQYPSVQKYLGIGSAHEEDQKIEKILIQLPLMDNP